MQFENVTIEKFIELAELADWFDDFLISKLKEQGADERVSNLVERKNKRNELVKLKLASVDVLRIH